MERSFRTIPIIEKANVVWEYVVYTDDNAQENYVDVKEISYRAKHNTKRCENQCVESKYVKTKPLCNFSKFVGIKQLKLKLKCT